MGIEAAYVNIIKAMYEKSTGNIILNGQKLKEILLRSGAKQGFALLPLLFNTALRLLSTGIRQDEEIKGIHTGK